MARWLGILTLPMPFHLPLTKAQPGSVASMIAPVALLPSVHIGMLPNRLRHPQKHSA